MGTQTIDRAVESAAGGKPAQTGSIPTSVVFKGRLRGLENRVWMALPEDAGVIKQGYGFELKVFGYKGTRLTGKESEIIGARYWVVPQGMTEVRFPNAEPHYSTRYVAWSNPEYRKTEE